MKGIDKLEKFLELQDLQPTTEIKFLRELQNLRSSGSAHCKGEKYQRAKQHFQIEEKGFIKSFEENIVMQCIDVMSNLEKMLLH